MKHQLFKKNTYLEIDTSMSHLMVIGQVKDSTITINRMPATGAFRIPIQSIEIEPKIMIVYEDPEFEMI